jgi:hypothetical protein
MQVYDFKRAQLWSFYLLPSVRMGSLSCNVANKDCADPHETSTSVRSVVNSANLSGSVDALILLWNLSIWKDLAHTQRSKAAEPEVSRVLITAPTPFSLPEKQLVLNSQILNFRLRVVRYRKGSFVMGYDWPKQPVSSIGRGPITISTQAATWAYR